MLDVVELTSVSSAVRREEATIDDARDERQRAGFEIVTAADVGEPRHEWHVDGYPFGVKHLVGMTIRWLNLGRAGEPASGTRLLSGHEHPAPLFRVCAKCGKVDTGTGRNSAAEHRPWCPQRKALDEDVRAVALSRTLTTEGVVLRLPAGITVADRYAVPSLGAAVQLGMREHLGGAPDHLAVEQVVDPTPGDDSGNRDALLVHDVVPGGTGYLAELSEPAKLWAVLHRAWTVVRDCPCQHENRAACHRCLAPWINGPAGRYVSRAAAERHLRDILQGGTDEDPEEAMGWTVVAKSTASYDPETHIEQKFRSVLHRRLVEGLGASVTEQPGPNGNRWTIVLGGRTWTLEPQLQLGQVKPDFVLVCSDPSVPRAAVFCDGWRFHACTAGPVDASANRIADDAWKRAALRAQGYVVVAVTWQDLVDAEEGTVAAPVWFAENRWSKAVQVSNGALRPALRDLVVGGPVDLLASWIAQPDPDGLTQLAEHLPLLLVGAGERGKVELTDALEQVALAFQDDGALPTDGAKAAWSWRRDTLAVVARNTHGRATEIVVVLDDRDERLGPQHKEAWNSWLRMANLLNRRLQEAHVLARSQVVGAVSQPAVDVVQTDVAVSLSAPWQDLVDQVLGEPAKQLLVILAEAALAPPVVGHEVGDGVPLEISWPDAHVVVDLELTDDDRSDLAGMGWVVVPADVTALRDALTNAGAH